MLAKHHGYLLSSLPMNRILLEQDEVGADGRACVTGRRAAHIVGVLKPAVGDSLRVGMVNGGAGMGEVLSVERGRVALACRFDEALPSPPRIDVLLAVPRPKVMRRLWSALASLGVGRIVLTNAEKVERNYFDTHWLEEETYRPLLIEGLEQSGDTRLPQVTVCRRLKPFVEDVLDREFQKGRRLICHPREAQPVGRINLSEAPRILLAIGPEGGWSDYEVDLFARYGFDCVSLGWRTLRTDVACIALISAVNAALD
jgi:16S rRNA (uracil1498-N3)-methyltransferase